MIRYRDIQMRIDSDSGNQHNHTEHWPFYSLIHKFITKGKQLNDKNVASQVVKEEPMELEVVTGIQDEFCAKCYFKIESDLIQCEGECQKFYHLTQNCTGLPLDVLQKIILHDNQPWICKSCVDAKRELHNMNDESKNIWMGETDPEKIAKELNLDDFTESHENYEFSSNINGYLNNTKDFYSNNIDLNSIALPDYDILDDNNDDFLDLKSYLKIQEINFEEFNHEIMELQHENETLKLQIEDLEVKHHYFDQLALQNEIEIVALPQTPNENLIKLFLQICSVLLDVQMEKTSIINCFRTPQRYNDIPNIVIKLKDNATKKAVLKNRKGKYFSTISLGILPGKIFYINERLTQYYSNLYKSAKDLKKRGKIKDVWVDGGRILVRKNDVTRILILDHLHKIKELES